MVRISGRLPIVLTLLASIAAGSCGRSGGEPSTPTPTAPTPTAPTAPAGPADPPTTPPQPVACTYAVTAEPNDFERDGGNGSLRITTASGCHWTIAADATWAVIEGPTQGDGTAVVKVFVQPNDEALARRMSFIVQDKTVSVVQPGQGDCTFEVSPVLASIPRVQWSGDIRVNTSRGCSWIATSDAPWLRLGTTSGIGPGRVAYAADVNPGDGSNGVRAGVIALRWRAPTAGQNVRVNQWGDCTLITVPATGGLPPGATFAGNTAGGTITASADGGAFRLWVLTEPFMGCAWSLETSDTWLSITWPGVHQINGGDGDLVFTLPPNPSPQSRRATLVMDGRPLTIVQAGK